MTSMILSHTCNKKRKEISSTFARFRTQAEMLLHLTIPCAPLSLGDILGRGHPYILHGLYQPLTKTKDIHNKREKFAKGLIGVILINSFIYLLSALKTFPFPSCLNFLFLDHWAISYLPVLGIYPSCELQQTKTNRTVAQSSFYLFGSKMLQNIHSEDK